MMQNEEYLARGSDCSNLFVGYSHARYPSPNQQLVLLCRLYLRTEVEHAAKPLIIIAYQLYILLYAHDAGV